ncbi:restriction endonuclease subunit S [Prevotella nigrescens]|uniref:restriction endonuclease subunit S n=1 Tax=Prevotella nigrescens TaxID=28133 RepID=UPI0021508F9F|nr:restriction endonuclease subunit S [Prevotella nigrescens]
MEQAKNWEDVKPITDVNWLGCLLSSNLKRYKLGDIAEIIISSVDKKTKDGEQKVRLCNFVDVYHNWAITKSMHNSFMIASAKEKDIERLSLKKGYVALTKDSETRDDIGISTYIADNLYNVILGYHCALVKPNEDILSGKYLNAFLHSNYIKKYFELNATGSGMRYTLSIQTLYDMPILLPSLEEQEYIGNIFSTIDRKIELNRSINHNLEAMAKQLYYYWFVQFDFPDENGKPYKSSGGKMVWNEKLKREIPGGWEVTNIGSILDKVFITPRLSTDEYLPSGTYPIIDQATDVYYAGFTEREEAVVNQYPAIVFGDHSCAVKYVNFPFVRGADGTQVILSKDSNIPIEYLYYAMKGVKIGKGYARHFSFLKEQPVIVPSEKEVKDFEDTAQTFFEQITRNRKEILSLTKQRDELLPLLMNGQVSLNYDLSAFSSVFSQTILSIARLAVAI